MVTQLHMCCACHFFLMTVMLSFGGVLLKDVFTCEGCLWFDVGTEQSTSFSAASSSWNASTKETLQVSVKAYTGTVQEALGLNSYQKSNSDVADGCGMWVLHPRKWDEKPGKQIEFDVEVGSKTIVLEQGAAVTTGGLSVAPLSNPGMDSSCRIGLGSDGQLRDFNHGSEVISVDKCNKVSFISDDSSHSTSLAYKGRNVFGILGVIVFLLVRIIQYFALFSGLATTSEVKIAKGDEETAGKDWQPSGQPMVVAAVDKCFHNLERRCGRFWAWSFAAFDFVFFSEFPALILLPLNALNFHEDCDQILTFQFSATLWMVGTSFAVVGVIFHSADALLPVLYGARDENIVIIWPRMMFCVGVVLTLLVVSLKMIYILRMGFSFAFGLKLEWAFKFQFWPLSQAICLDMFQLSAFCFSFYDKCFAAFAGYLKYFASEPTKLKQAGKFGEAVRQKVDKCQVKICNTCNKVQQTGLVSVNNGQEKGWEECTCPATRIHDQGKPESEDKYRVCNGLFQCIDGEQRCSKCKCPRHVVNSQEDRNGPQNRF